MEDPNLIAYLFPADDPTLGYALDTIKLSQNGSRYVAPQKRKNQGPPTDPDYNKDESYLSNPALLLTFDHMPNSLRGFDIGTNPKCDIVLPNLTSLKGISGHHGIFTFDAQLRFIFRDTSKHGSYVTYDGEGREKRRDFTWILSGHGDIKKVVVEFHKHLKFQVVVCPHDEHVAPYRENVGRLLQGSTVLGAGLSLRTLDIRDAPLPAIAATGAQTFNQSPLLLKHGILGRGAFSVVSLVRDVSTGLEYASKKLLNQGSDWESEASIMKQAVHQHIVRLVFALAVPSPRLVLEYLPLGNLEAQHRKRRISADEVIGILKQSLSALEYLHGQKPPIVHRDIKLENILVQSRDPLHIKLADFGLARASDYLSTFCGTWTYLAPEIAIYCEQPLTVSSQLYERLNIIRPLTFGPSVSLY